jgi:hypothetical protein
MLFTRHTLTSAVEEPLAKFKNLQRELETKLAGLQRHSSANVDGESRDTGSKTSRLARCGSVTRPSRRRPLCPNQRSSTRWCKIVRLVSKIPWNSNLEVTMGCTDLCPSILRFWNRRHISITSYHRESRRSGAAEGR